jgi:hypothetical protein
MLNLWFEGKVEGAIRIWRPLGYFYCVGGCVTMCLRPKINKVFQWGPYSWMVQDLRRASRSKKNAPVCFLHSRTSAFRVDNWTVVSGGLGYRYVVGMFSLRFGPLAASFFHYFRQAVLLKFSLNWPEKYVYYTCIVYNNRHGIILCQDEQIKENTMASSVRDTILGWKLEGY